MMKKHLNGNKNGSVTSRKDIKISEHAKVRFMERLYNINFKRIESYLSAMAYKRFKTLGDGKYPIDENIIVVVKGGVVVTVLGRETV